MPMETTIFVVFTLVAFCGFAATLWGVDRFSSATRRTRHPLPGE